MLFNRIYFAVLFMPIKLVEKAYSQRHLKCARFSICSYRYRSYVTKRSMLRFQARKVNSSSRLLCRFTLGNSREILQFQFICLLFIFNNINDIHISYITLYTSFSLPTNILLSLTLKDFM